MTAQTTLQTLQRRHLRLVVATARHRQPVRIVVLPAPVANGRQNPGVFHEPAGDDLDQATWEDAEWR